MTDPTSIWEYCIDGFKHIVPENDDPNLQMFVNTVTQIVSDVNCFDFTKYPCAISDQKCYTFDTCPALKQSNIPYLYLKLLLLRKRFVLGLWRLDPAGNKHHNDFNFVREISLAELDACEILTNSPISTVFVLTVNPKDQLTNVVNLLRETCTPLLSSHNGVVDNLASVLASVSGSASNHVPSTTTNNNTNNHNASTGSTNNDFVEYLTTLPLVSCQSVSPNKPLQALGGGIQRLFYIQNDDNNDNNNDFIN